MLAPKSNETMWEYWVSFWPFAPMLGVAWRFEALTPTAQFFSPSTIAAQMAAASARETAVAADETAQAVAASAEALTGSVEQVADAVEAVAHGFAPEPLILEAAPLEAAPVEVGPAEPEGGQALARPAQLYDAPPAAVDDLKQIKGVGPKLEQMLNAMGIYRLEQIASFTEANLAWVDDNLTAFKGRPLRDDWVAQARALL